MATTSQTIEPLGLFSGQLMPRLHDAVIEVMALDQQHPVPLVCLALVCLVGRVPEHGGV